MDFSIVFLNWLVSRSKTSLKLAASRIKLLKNKRDAQVKQLKRELAQLLESGQDQTARIRVRGKNLTLFPPPSLLILFTIAIYSDLPRLGWFC